VRGREDETVALEIHPERMKYGPNEDCNQVKYKIGLLSN